MCKRTASLFFTFVILTSFFITANAQDPDIFPDDPEDPIIIAPISAGELLVTREAIDGLLNAHETDLAAYLPYVTEDFVFELVPNPPFSIEQAMAYFAAAFNAFPDWYTTEAMILASGNTVVVTHSSGGTHLGELDLGSMGILPSTGNAWETPHLDIFDFEGDKVRKTTTYQDAASQLIQLGVLPASEFDPALLAPSFPLPDPEPTGLSPAEADAELTIRFNSHDLSQWAKMYHQDAIVGYGSLGMIPLDRNQFTALQELNLLGFPDVSLEVTRRLDLGDGWILSEAVSIGTHTGPYFGIPASGNNFPARWAWLIRFDADGLVTEQNVYFDHLSILMQIGALEPAPPETEANKELVRRYLEEAWNQQNLELAAEIVSPDMVGYVPEGDLSDPEIASQHIPGTLAAFPDFHITIEEMIAEGDKVGVRYTTLGTHEGPLMGMIPPTGKQITSTGVGIFQIADGKIVGAWSMADMLGMMQQIGVVPSDREDYTWGEPSEVTGAPGDPEANKAIVRRNLEELWNQGDLDVADETVDPNFVYHLVGGPEVRSSEAFKQYVAMTRAAFPDIEFTIEDMIAEGDKVALRWTVRGTQKGEFMGIPPADKQVIVKGISIERFADGKLVEGWTSSDYLGMMQQLGVIPPMEPPVVEEGPLAGIHTSISSGIVTDSGEMEQVIKDGVMHIITDGFEYEMQVESAWDNGETTVSSMKVRGYMDLVPISETEAVGKAYSITEQYSPDGELTFVGSAESDVTASLVTGGSSSRFYIYASGLGEYAGYSHISIGETRIWIDEDGTRRVEATADCIVSKIEHDFTIASASLAATEAEAPLTGLHTSELSGLITNPGEVTQETIGGVTHIITRGIEYDQQVDTVWDTGETDVVSMESYADMDLVPISAAEAVGNSNFTSIAYSENDEPIWFISGESDVTADLTTGESWSKIFAVGSGYGRNAGYTHISVVDFHAWVNEEGVAQVEGTSRCLVMKVMQDMSKAYFVEVQPGLNMISMPLDSMVPHTARSLAEKLSATVVIEYNEAEGRFVGFTLDAPDSGFDVLGGKGYIVNVAEGGVVGFTGTGWSNQPPAMASPPVSSGAWAFVVSGSVLDGDMMSTSDGEYTVTVKNLRTSAVTDETVGESGYFAAAYADLSRKAVVEAGDKVEVAVVDSSGMIVSGPFVHDITLDGIRNAVVKVQLRLGHIIPEKSVLLQNYPNPFNPETWIPFHLKGEASVSIRIFSLSGQLIRSLDLGHRDAGIYVSRSKSAYWDGKNEAGEEVSSGIYFYSITAGDFSATKKMIIRK